MRYFCNIPYTLARNLNLLKNLCICTWKFSLYSFENVIAFTGLTQRLWDINDLSKFFQLQTLIYPKHKSHSIINNTILWKCVSIPLRCIYVNCFNRLRFLPRLAQNCKTCIFLENVRAAILETRLMTRFFHLLFPL